MVRARQIPEWDVYDKEVAAFAARLQEQSGEVESVIAANVDDLVLESNPSEAVTPEDDVAEYKNGLGSTDGHPGERIPDEL